MSMRRYFLVFSIILAPLLFDATRILRIVQHVVMTPFRTAYAETYRHVVRFSVRAFETLKTLKPEYRESYKIHGLSLYAGRG